MKIDGGLGFDVGGIARQAAKAESDGYDGVWSAETGHDPFLPIAVGADATETLEFGTAIAVAFARNPMTLAVLGWRPAAADQGSLHARTRQPDQAAHHQALLHGVEPPGTAHARDDPRHPGHLGHVGERATPLAFRGEFYTHTLMTPFFTPGARTPHGDPKIFLAGVGELMTEVAGEVCDGFICPRIHHRALPARGHACRRSNAVAAKAGKTMDGFEIVSCPGIRRHRDRRRELPGGLQGYTPADRLLRVDAGLPPRARTARVGRPAARAQHAVQAGRVGEDGRADRRRHP